MSRPSNAAPGTVLITGATSGIGLAIARQLSVAGSRVVLVGRRPLDEFDDPLFRPATYCRCDLSDPDAAAVIDRWCTANGVAKLDALINNAGVGWSGDLWDQPTASIRELVAVNLAAPIDVTQRLLPRVRAAEGTVLFVSSVASTVAFPDLAVYVATKKALDGFVRSLRAERSSGPVTFQVVHPGATKTAMPDKVGVPEEVSRSWASADAVASDIVARLEGRPRRNVAIGSTNRLVRAASVGAPGLVARAVGRRQTNVPTLAEPGPTKRVLITGAADGIGRALALRYAGDGWSVVGVDVDDERAAETLTLDPTGRIEFRHVDLIASDMSWVGEEEPFDAVVHNAGISAVGSFESIDPSEHHRVIGLNLVAPLVLSRELLARGKVRPGGRFVFMSSLSHQLGYPGAAVYAATKDGLERYGRAMEAALRPNVETLTVFPGPTRTAHAARYSPADADESRRMDPAALADLIVDHDRARLLPGVTSKAAAALGTLVPPAGEAIMRRTVFAKLP